MVVIMKKFLFSKSRFIKFLICYVLVLIIASGIMLANVYSLLRKFEASQPEMVVEQQIELLRDAAKNGTLDSVMPVSGSAAELLATNIYPKSFVDCIAGGEMTYEQKAGAFGANAAAYTILSDGKPVVDIELESSNPRTEMIVFSSADWALKSMQPVVFEREFKLPKSIKLEINGSTVVGEASEDGYYNYNIACLGNDDIVISDIFNNYEKQYRTVRKSFPGITFSLPSNYKVTFCGNEIKGDFVKSTPIAEYEYVSKYTEMPTLLTYNISYLFPEDGDSTAVVITDNLGNPIEMTLDELDGYEITYQNAIVEVPSEYFDEAGIFDFAEKWSLFMTNDLSGGLSEISKYLIRDSYLYDVAYNWATGVDRTFTSVHRLYNPPFEQKKAYNFVKYSEDCFSCNVYLVKKMRIANGLDVDDELSKKLFFVKYDGTNDGRDNPKWVVADMVGPDNTENPATHGGDVNE